jgi:hypothetical protein
MTAWKWQDAVCLWLAMGCVLAGDSLAPAAEPPPAVASRSARPEAKPAGATKDHPLQAVLQWSQQTTARIERDIHDYSALFLKREADDGELGDRQRMLVKVRHTPLSVYVYFFDPSDRRGEEAIYFAGRNEGNLLAHTTGITGSLLGTMSLAPDGAVAMDGQHRPLTEIGILNLCRRLTQVAEKGRQNPLCRVETIRDKKVDERACRCIQITNPDDRQQFLFSQIRWYVDEQLDLPVRFEAYDWPAEPGAEPPLSEEYTYTKIKLNNGYTDRDFDVKNPRYGFAEGRSQ